MPPCGCIRRNNYPVGGKGRFDQVDVLVNCPALCLREVSAPHSGTQRSTLACRDFHDFLSCGHGGVPSRGKPRLVSHPLTPRLSRHDHSMTNRPDLLKKITVRLGNRGLRTAGSLRNRSVDHQPLARHGSLPVGLDGIQVVGFRLQRDVVKIIRPFPGKPPVLVQVGAVNLRRPVPSPVKPVQLDQVR